MEKVQADLRDMIEANAQINYLQRMVKIGQQDLRESEEREARLQRKLEGAELELMHTKSRVANLQTMLENREQDLRESRRQQEQLISDYHTIQEKWKAVCNQLDVATREHGEARKNNESLKVCYVIATHA